MIPYGYCHCGCGSKTSLATVTRRGRGWVKGEPLRFATGHRDLGPRYEERDCGFSSPCWIWLRARSSKGYGRCGGPGTQFVHRRFYEKACGAVPEGLELDHLCRVRACVNPDHMEPVTHAENIRRGYAVCRGDLADGLGGELKRARLEAKLSQRELACVAGCSQTRVRRWEANQWEPSPVLLWRLKSILNLREVAAA